MKNFPQRKPNRLKNFDYSSEAVYFITICVKQRHNLLWKYISDLVEPDVGATIGRPYNEILSEYGQIVDQTISIISEYYSCITIYKYVIMPNHIHVLMAIQNETSGRPLVAPTISTVVQQMKGVITKQIGFSIWQKSFHDHIVRNEEEFLKIWKYIEDNPTSWSSDCYYTD